MKHGHLIGADALMEAINTCPKFGVDERGRMVLWSEGYEPYIRLRDVVIAITGTSTIEPESQWIPCSKTIDIPDHEVLCCDRHGEELIGWLSYVDDQWLCESDGEMMYNPVAWREKPEPYREEGETDDSN